MSDVKVFNYGDFSFEWVFEEAPIKEHVITVEKNKAVLLRGEVVSIDVQKSLLLKKARWIKKNILAMAKINQDDIVSGSRIKYSGRNYMAVLKEDSDAKSTFVNFTASKFFITVPSFDSISQEAIRDALEAFYRRKANERLIGRVKHLEGVIGLYSSGVKLRKFKARWASCSVDKVIEFHPRCMELSPKVLDYVIVHELCHTVEMTHSKAFWKLVESKCNDWEECHKTLSWEL